MRNPIRRIAPVACALLLLVAGCNPAKDAFLFVNSTSAPNVTPAGTLFMLHFRVFSAAEKAISKPITVTLNYTQMNPKAMGKVDPSKQCNASLDGDCDQPVSRTVQLATPTLAPGDTSVHTIRIGEDVMGRECATFLNCRGTATIEFTNGGNNKQTMKVKWSIQQAGNPETLEVTCCKA